MKWTKIIEKANTLSDREILEEYRGAYLYDPRHLEVAELKWARLFLDARVLMEEIEEGHTEYYKFAAKMGQKF